jgi:hypothetical protein
MPFPMTKAKAAICVALLVVTTFVPFDMGWRYWQLRTRGIEAPATVTGVREISHGRVQHYIAIYQFADGAGRRRTGSQDISEDLYEVLKATPNLAVKIVYNPDRPDLNVLNLHSLGNQLFWWGGSVGFVWIILALALFGWHRENSGIVASMRRRVLLDQARRASATPGYSPSTRRPSAPDDRHSSR